MRKITARIFLPKVLMVLYHVRDDHLKFGRAKAYLHFNPGLMELERSDNEEIEMHKKRFWDEEMTKRVQKKVKRLICMTKDEMGCRRGQGGSVDSESSIEE